MIFASDLDKTLIFSKRHLPSSKKLVLAETKNKAPVAFMAEDTFNGLKSFISKKGIFIPATARTQEQYDRIDILKLLPIKYAIICNGKRILINGKSDPVWEEKMNQKIATLPKQIPDIFEEVKSFTESNLPDSTPSYYLYDNYMAMISFPDAKELTETFIEDVNKLMKNTGWYAFACGRKLYISTNFINKKFALEYIKETLLKNEHKAIASGDSLYDLEMLQYSDFPIIPRNAEIADVLKTTNETNFKGSIEIVDYILELTK